MLWRSLAPAFRWPVVDKGQKLTIKNLSFHDAWTLIASIAKSIACYNWLISAITSVELNDSLRQITKTPMAKTMASVGRVRKMCTGVNYFGVRIRISMDLRYSQSSTSKRTNFLKLSVQVVKSSHHSPPKKAFLGSAATSRKNGQGYKTKTSWLPCIFCCKPQAHFFWCTATKTLHARLNAQSDMSQQQQEKQPKKNAWCLYHLKFMTTSTNIFNKQYAQPNWLNFKSQHPT